MQFRRFHSRHHRHSLEGLPRSDRGGNSPATVRCSGHPERNATRVIQTIAELAARLRVFGFCHRAPFAAKVLPRLRSYVPCARSPGQRRSAQAEMRRDPALRPPHGHLRQASRGRSPTPPGRSSPVACTRTARRGPLIRDCARVLPTSSTLCKIGFPSRVNFAKILEPCQDDCKVLQFAVSTWRLQGSKRGICGFPPARE